MGFGPDGKMHVVVEPVSIDVGFLDVNTTLDPYALFCQFNVDYSSGCWAVVGNETSGGELFASAGVDMAIFVDFVSSGYRVISSGTDGSAWVDAPAMDFNMSMPIDSVEGWYDTDGCMAVGITLDGMYMNMTGCSDNVEDMTMVMDGWKSGPMLEMQVQSCASRAGAYTSSRTPAPSRSSCASARTR